MIELLKISLIAFMFSSLTQENESLLSWYGRLINKFPWYLRKPLGGCYRCFTGQVCFWYFLINRIAMNEYDFFEHLFFVSAGILISMIYNEIYCYLK